MNLLTFISSLLLILALSAHLLRSSVIDSKRLHLTYKGYKKVFRKNQNLFQKKLYEQAKEKSKPKPTTTKPSEKKRKYVPQKTDFFPECMKFDLCHLTELEQFEHTPKFDFFIRLLKALYQKTLLLDASESSIRTFAKQLILQLKKMHNEKFHIHLEKLSHPENHYLYYRMIKGAQNGKYPSLLQYVKLQSNTSKICLPCADKFIFSALSSDKIAQKIMATKEHDLDRITLSSKELQNYLEEVPNNLSMHESIQYKHTERSLNGATTLRSKDQQTDIQLNQQVFLLPEI